MWDIQIDLHNPLQLLCADHRAEGILQAVRRHPAAFLWTSARSDHRVKATATKGILQDVRRCRKSMRQVTSLAAKRSHFKIVLSSLCVASLNVQIIANLLAFSSSAVDLCQFRRLD
jgi:hypothetical protein